ncbi:ectopic P granules protein 5 homolog isoform X2 [Planococcus citri]|uniref:ectopic P granules protein 5 homolog isoform X2 n=1 Tax=Planococcus citri TaxID=170843 RepID=UPI0031F9545C
MEAEEKPREAKKSTKRDVLSSAVIDIERALNEVTFPEVPKDPLEDLKDDEDSFEGEAEHMNVLTQPEPESLEDLQSCEEITETVPIDDCIDAIASLNDSFTSNTDEKPDVYPPSAPFGGVESSQFNYPDQSVFGNKADRICYPDLIAQISMNVSQYKSNAEKLAPFTPAEMAAHYCNQELHNYDVFVNNFIEVEFKSGSVVRQPLHELLIQYLTCRDNLCKNGIEFDTLINDYKQYQEKIWNSHTSSYTEHGECQDGNGVSATHHYKVSHFNEYIYDNFSRSVNQLEILTTEFYITNVFNVQLYRTKIEHYVHSLCYHFSFIHPHAPIELYNESAPRGPLGADFKLFIHELKSAISVLFSFQRRPMKDEEFIAETRKWLEKLISVLLRVSTANDHLFIIHHIMRCPAGVSKWATRFIQPPVPHNGRLYSQKYVDHLITTLAIILLPVTDRSLFLQQMEVGLEENGVWVIVDSDGEDSDENSTPKTALKENDLVAFLNQIPFADVFRQIILVGRRESEDVYDVNVITDHDILRSIAISSLLVHLLDKGIANYSCFGYKQFCKRLSLLIKHTACYITDHWELFREAYTQRSIVDSAMLNRLQTEYDEFLFRVVNNLYTTRDRIGWQYLATLPFNMITSHSLWKIYQYLLYTKNENDILMSEEFMESMAELPDDEIYYFLTTITNMALLRPKQDWLFIQTVTLQLFQVGFVNVSVRDKCMKNSRILIANLTSKHPELISDLVVSLKKEFVLVGKFSLYLFRELPISSWKPNHVDSLALNDWLLNCCLTSSENNLARYIISQLNWSTDLNELDLFLPREFHCQTAIMIVKTLYLYAEEVPTASSTAIISQSVRQVSSVVRGQTPEQILNSWAWQILSKLKLHLMDQPVRMVRMALTDMRMTARIPDINSDSEDMRIISNGIARNQSVSFYVALLMSNLGHDLPLICEKCWDYCCILLSTYKYTQVLQILQLVLPYFLESIESLLKLEKFQSVIIQLLNADQTYMKMAKNLIISDFPRPILSQFAALVQFHVDNYARYTLPNPNQMVELWMRILSSVWKENCPAVAYLMDKILSTVLNNEHLKHMINNILSTLIETLTANRYTVSGGLSSLVSWIGYGGGADVHMIPESLLPRSSATITHSPYFAYFALHLEEELFVAQTSLWTEVLKNLASISGKANVDAALKKACATNKLNAVGSNCLPIYRWAQYGMEIGHDHPILPLYWQRFFRLYLQRVPGGNYSGCVGSKFFEGTMNGSYFKRIKKKLQDCSDHFSTKPVADQFEKAKYDNLNQLYKTLTLWLEEPRLQEPDVYLPAFSAVFNAPKLAEILRGELNIWLEYVDFDNIREEQKELIGKWARALFRDVNPASNRIYCFPEDCDTFKRIVERLQSYDQRVPPPELFLMRSAVPEIPRESLLNKTVMLDHLVEHFHLLVQYTRSYEIEKNDQIETARKLLEAFKYLYQNVDVNVELQAACDTVSSTSKRRTVSTINCAGPATLLFQVRESRLNKTAKHTIERCDTDFQRLLKHNLKTPPFQVTIACIVIELAAESLQKERSEVSAIGDITILNSIQDVGVTLFYKLTSLYDTQICEYFPTKLFFRNNIERLGQSFIDKNENECPKLLSTLMNNPKLATVLVPHFTPAVVSATTFVHLYRKVTLKIMTKNSDFILNVLTKFSVKEWLRTKSPRLADRSQMVEILSQALKDIGSQPLESLSCIHKILRRDLCEILVHEFPEHYGEILHVLLKYSAEEKFSCDVWFDVLNSLFICANGSSNLFIDNDVVPLRPGLSLAQIRDVARKYASELRSLTFQELVETANVLGSNFLKERQQYGLYGLYPKYTKYIEPIIALHSMIGHAAITSILHVQRGALADKISEKILPVLVNLFSPWIVPYFTGNLQEPLAPWIQQLSEDRSVLLPWVPSDVAVANKMMSTFTECVKFISEALPASNVILSTVCKWYISQYANQSVKEHVLTIVQNNLITLNWSRFVPSVEDLEWILKVIDQYLPVCHSFLGSIFIEIPWNVVVQSESSPQITARIHIILLHLLIKLANEPNLRQSGKVSVLLMEARHYHWHLVDAANYEHVLDWFVMSYDSRVILLLTDEDWNGIDMAAFDLLQVAAGYVTDINNFHQTTLRKRQMFVKACVRMALQLANRYKAVLAVHQSDMESALVRMLDKMESVVNQTVVAENRASECAILLSELLVLINQPTGGMLPELMTQVLLNWLSNRSASSPVLQGLLRIIGTTINDHIHLGVIMETCLASWFKNLDDTEAYDWETVLNIMQPVAPAHTSIEDSLVTNNQILSLYALTLKQMRNDGNIFIYSKLIQWVICLKPNTDNESKLPLLWSLAFKECSQNIQEIMPSLLKLCNHFQQIINMKPGWALFGVIGMNKQTVPSIRCKILCNALNAFILMKLSAENSKSSVEKGEVTSPETADKESDRSLTLVSAECIKAISNLDSLANDKHYAEYRITIDSAVRLIKSKEVTLSQGEQFILTLAKQLYTEGYIHAFHCETIL